MQPADAAQAPRGRRQQQRQQRLGGQDALAAARQHLALPRRRGAGPGPRVQPQPQRQPLAGDDAGPARGHGARRGRADADGLAAAAPRVARALHAAADGARADPAADALDPRRPADRRRRRARAVPARPLQPHAPAHQRPARDAVNRRQLALRQPRPALALALAHVQHTQSHALVALALARVGEAAGDHGPPGRLREVQDGRQGPLDALRLNLGVFHSPLCMPVQASSPKSALDLSFPSYLPCFITHTLAPYSPLFINPALSESASAIVAWLMVGGRVLFLCIGTR